MLSGGTFAPVGKKVQEHGFDGRSRAWKVSKTRVGTWEQADGVVGILYISPLELLVQKRMRRYCMR